MLNNTFQPKPGADLVAPFVDEALNVAFVANGRSAYTVQSTNITVLGRGPSVEFESFYVPARRYTATGSSITAGRVDPLASSLVELEGTSE